ncbi:unnamed protein product [Trichobilharzia szidati]|nr:unnamed protein product [Trichobilharzia szidati]
MYLEYSFGFPQVLRRFLKDVLNAIAYMFFLTTKCRVTMKDKYKVTHQACVEYLTLCGMTSRMFYVNDELGKNHPDVPKQLPLLSFDQPDEQSGDFLPLDLTQTVNSVSFFVTQSRTQEDKARTVLGGVNVLDKYIEHLKERSYALEKSTNISTYIKKVSTYIKKVQEMETLFPKGSLEEDKNPE